MDLPVTTTNRRRRKPASVIEATDAAPMPLVEAIDPVAEPAPGAELTAVTSSPIPAPATNVAAHEPATPPAAVPAEPQKEEIMTIETLTQPVDAAAHGTEGVFADVNARAKGAMEKGAKIAEDFAAFNKGNLEALVESGKIAARGFESLGQDAAAFAKASFEQQTAAWKTLATVKSPTEFLKVQGDLVRQSFDQLVQQGSRQSETVLKLAGEVAQPISNRFAVAAEKIKVAA